MRTIIGGGMGCGQPAPGSRPIAACQILAFSMTVPHKVVMPFRPLVL
jgi:hypothetical protein